MKRILYPVFLSFFLVIFSGSIHAQSLHITDSTTTSSICFNDGTITVHAAGGTPGYTYSITAGPTYPNITYPITLTAGVNVFQTLPAGQYTIKVTDAIGNTSFATATVKGNYQFPVINTNVAGSCIKITSVSGKRPLKYAISTVSNSSGFGTYQAADSFCGLCTGDYWVRVKDSCDNIFTTLKITLSIAAPGLSLNCSSGSTLDSIKSIVSGGSSPFSFTIKNGAYSVTNSTGTFLAPKSCSQDTVTLTDACNKKSTSIPVCGGISLFPICMDASHGTGSIVASGGTLPYTYSYEENGVAIKTNTTGVFTGLPIFPNNGNYYFSVKDGCNRTTTYVYSHMRVKYDPICPFDSSITLINLTGDIFPPLVFTCVNCSPSKADTFYSRPPSPIVLFPKVGTGTFIIKLQDKCGFLRYDTIDLYPKPVTLRDSFFSCNDLVIKALGSYGQQLTPITINASKDGIFYQSSTTGVFLNLGPGVYKFSANYSGCAPDTLTLPLPKTPALCYLPTYDHSCIKVWDIFQAGSDFAETYSLVSVTSGLKYIETPAGANNGTLYNDVPPGNYNLVSDSGCTSPVSFPNHATITVSAVSFVSCLGNTKITCEATPPSLSTCAGAYPFRFGLYNKKDSFIASNRTGEFLNMDTGVYIIKLLYDNTLSFNILPAWPDTVCAIDTEMVYVTNRPLPFIAAKQVKVCGQVKADIPFTIYGGAAPYTLQIQGYPAVNVNSNAGIYPNVSPGIYTLIVFDDCGISNSFSVSVLDSCSGCSGLSANFKVADSIVCKNSKVNFINQSNNADSYLWKVNGINYGTQPDTSILAKTGSYTVTLYAFKTTCKDSFTITIKTVDSINVKLENDTVYCGSFSRVLSTGAPATLWSTGVIAPQITVTQAGVYWAQLSNACGVSRDSITILERYFPAFDLGADTSVCNGDSVLLKVSVDSASFLWSNGSVDSFVLLKNQPANPVWIRISRNGCERSDSIRVYFLNPPQPFTLGVDTYFCENSPFLLSTSDTNTVWSTGVKGSFITVSDSGTYIATITNICGSQADTIHLNKEVIPQGFEVTADKVLVCESEPDSVLIKAVVNDNGQPPVIFSWNTGLRDTAYASSLLIDSSGTFFVKADNGKCSVSKEITIGRKFCGLECLEKYAIPNIFTPNEDGKNDTFKVLHLCPIDPFIMHIYDRWGGLLFESHDIEFGWDGKFKGKEQPEEVYVYWVCLGLPNRTEQKCLMGTVTLVR